MAGEPSYKRSKKKIAPLSTLTGLSISIVLHLVIFLSVGSAVIFEGKMPLVLFFGGTEDPAGAVLDVLEEMPLLEEDPPELETNIPESEMLPDNTMDASDVTATMDVITSTAVTSAFPTSFNMPTTPGNLSGKLLGSGDGSGQDNGPGKGKIKLSSLFGSHSLGAGTLSGFLYDFKQDAQGRPTELASVYSTSKTKGSERQKAFRTELAEFLESWDESKLEKYYRTKQPLSTTQILIPRMAANGAPEAFDVAAEVDPSAWVILYKGNITPPQSGSFRFAGRADDLIMVRVDGKVVFDGNFGPSFYPEARVEIIDTGFGKGDRAGQWVRLRAGDTYPIEILVSEIPGGTFYARLFIQEKGVEYNTRENGSIILPPFQMMPTEIPPGFEGKILEEGPVFGAN